MLDCKGLHVGGVVISLEGGPIEGEVGVPGHAPGICLGHLFIALRGLQLPTPLFQEAVCLPGEAGLEGGRQVFHPLQRLGCSALTVPVLHIGSAECLYATQLSVISKAQRHHIRQP